MTFHYIMEKIAHVFLQLVGAALMFGTLWYIETRFFPVVKDFKVSYIHYTGGTYTAGGSLNKARVCEFIGLTIYGTKDGEPKSLLTQYKKDIFGADVGQGEQTWGPWSIQFPASMADADELEIMGSHRCHAFWMQTTVYTKIKMDDLRAVVQ